MNKQWGLSKKNETTNTSRRVYVTLLLYNDNPLRRKQRTGPGRHAISTFCEPNTSKLHQFRSKSSKTWRVIGWSPAMKLYPHLVKPKLSDSVTLKTHSTATKKCCHYRLTATWRRLQSQIMTGPSRGEFRPRQTRQLPRGVDLKGRLLSCQSY